MRQLSLIDIREHRVSKFLVFFFSIDITASMYFHNLKLYDNLKYYLAYLNNNIHAEININ